MGTVVAPGGRAAVLLGGTSEIFPHRDYNDVWRAELPPARPADELSALLRRNKEAYDPSWSPPGLPPALFQDHIAFDLVSLYLLGANASRLDAAYAYHQQTELLAAARPA